MKSIKKLSVLVFLCFVFTTCVPSIVSIAKTLDGERPKVVFSSNAFILAEQVNVQLQKLDEELEQTYILDIKNLQKNNALEISAEKINDEDTLYTIKKKFHQKQFITVTVLLVKNFQRGRYLLLKLKMVKKLCYGHK